MYKFKPFEFKVLKKNHNPHQRPLPRSGHRVVCNNTYLYSYGGYNPQTNVRKVSSLIIIILFCSIVIFQLVPLMYNT